MAQLKPSVLQLGDKTLFIYAIAHANNGFVKALVYYRVSVVLKYIFIIK